MRPSVAAAQRISSRLSLRWAPTHPLPLAEATGEEPRRYEGDRIERSGSSIKYKSEPTAPGSSASLRYPNSEQAIISGIVLKISETLMPRPSNKMRELRTALALALGLAIASFGTAIVAAAYIAK
jgi:hypothetical protein